jgi:hypothetical protein
VFSYNSKLPEANNARMFEGVSVSRCATARSLSIEIIACGTAFVD